MAEKIVNKHIIFEFVFEKKHPKKCCKNWNFSDLRKKINFLVLKQSLCKHLMVLGSKMADILNQKKTREKTPKNTKKAPRIRKNEKFRNRALSCFKLAQMTS